jgi:ribosome-associated translation inhibitor RaiA
MDLPIEITFRGMEPSDAVDARIRERAEELTRFCSRIQSCRVVVESGHHRHKHGRLRHLRIHLAVPEGEIVVNRDPSEHHAHEDIYVAIRDAFDAARRQLEEHARRLRGDVKTHRA